MRIVFMGTPDFAVPSLEALVRAGYDVAAVVSQPDRAKDRSGKVLFTDVKQCAVELGLPVLQFARIRSDDGVDALKRLAPDIMVTAAYGQILSQEIIDIPRFGIVNVHASLLPKYRGSAPVQWAVINGEKRTGVTIMQTAAGLDTGDILSVCETEIGENETAGELFERLKKAGAQLLLETLPKIERGEVVPIPQNAADATKCTMLTKEMGRLDFSKSAAELHNLVRGLNPWPVAYTTLSGTPLKIYRTSKANGSDLKSGGSVTADKCGRAADGEGKPGEIVSADPQIGLVVRCGEGFLKIEELQLPNKRRMSAREFLLGHKLTVGTVLGGDK